MLSSVTIPWAYQSGPCTAMPEARTPKEVKDMSAQMIARANITTLTSDAAASIRGTLLLLLLLLLVEVPTIPVEHRPRDLVHVADGNTRRVGEGRPPVGRRLLPEVDGTQELVHRVAQYAKEPHGRCRQLRN